MSGPGSTNLSRYSIPVEDRILLAQVAVLGLAGATARGELDVHGRPFAAQVFDDLLAKAIVGGFEDGAMLECYGQAESRTPRAMQLANEMVRCIGGHDAVLDICDLHATWPGAIGGARC